MRALRTFTLTLLVALCGAGASSARADAKKETPLSAAHAEQLLAFFNELVDESVKNAADCEALANAVNGVVTRRINTIQMMWASKKAKQTVPKDVQEKMDRRAFEMVGALRRCWDDDRVTAAFKRMKAPKEYE
jgi:hypothetical protein